MNQLFRSFLSKKAVSRFREIVEFLAEKAGLTEEVPAKVERNPVVQRLSCWHLPSFSIGVRLLGFRFRHCWNSLDGFLSGFPLSLWGSVYSWSYF